MKHIVVAALVVGSFISGYKVHNHKAYAIQGVPVSEAQFNSFMSLQAEANKAQHDTYVLQLRKEEQDYNLYLDKYFKALADKAKSNMKLGVIKKNPYTDFMVQNLAKKKVGNI